MDKDVFRFRDLHFVPVVPVGTPWDDPWALAAIADPFRAAQHQGLTFSQLALIGHGLYAVVPSVSHPRGMGLELTMHWEGMYKLMEGAYKRTDDSLVPEFLPPDAPSRSWKSASRLRTRLHAHFGNRAGGYEVYAMVRPRGPNWEWDNFRDARQTVTTAVRGFFEHKASIGRDRVHVLPGSTFEVFSFRYRPGTGDPPGVADGIRALRGEPLPPIDRENEERAVQQIFRGMDVSLAVVITPYRGHHRSKPASPKRRR